MGSHRVSLSNGRVTSEWRGAIRVVTAKRGRALGPSLQRPSPWVLTVRFPAVKAMRVTIPVVGRKRWMVTMQCLSSTVGGAFFFPFLMKRWFYLFFFLAFFFISFFKMNFYWSVFALQCCVGFYLQQSETAHVCVCVYMCVCVCIYILLFFKDFFDMGHV